MENLTNLEQKAIDLINQEIQWSAKGWFEYWIIEDYSDIRSKELRGVFSSLVQKGILEKKKADGTTYFRFV